MEGAVVLSAAAVAERAWGRSIAAESLRIFLANDSIAATHMDRSGSEGSGANELGQPPSETLKRGAGGQSYRQLEALGRREAASNEQAARVRYGRSSCLLSVGEVERAAQQLSDGAKATLRQADTVPCVGVSPHTTLPLPSPPQYVPQYVALHSSPPQSSPPQPTPPQLHTTSQSHSNHIAIT